MSIRNRILALVGGFAVMALVVTCLGLITINDYNRMMKDYDRAYESVWRGERLNHLVSNVVMETRGLYIAKDKTELDGFIQGLDGNLDAMDAFLVKWSHNPAPADTARLQAILAQSRNFIALRRQVAALARQDKLAEAEALSTANRPDRIRFQAAIDGLVIATQADLDVAEARAKVYSQRRAMDFFLTACFGICVMTALALWIVAHFVTRPLRDLASAIVRTSKGEYDAPFSEAGGHDEVAGVWQALKILRQRSIDAERLAAQQREAERMQEREMRQILLD